MTLSDSPLTSAVLDGMFVFGIIGVALFVVGVALEHWCHSASERRGLWRCSIALFILVIMIELLGAGRLITAPWINDPLMPQRQSRLSSPLSAVSAPGFESDKASYNLRMSSPIGEKAAVSSLGSLFGKIWLVASLLFLLVIIACQLLLLHIRRSLLPILDSSLTDRIRALADAVGLRQHLRIGHRTGITSPFVFGLFKPTLVLPQSFPHSLSEQHQDAVILHELAHLVDRDPFWLMLSDVLCVVLWWHPMSWLLRKRWRYATESAADEALYRMNDGPVLLAESLLACQREQQARWQPGLSMFSRSNSFLSQRIKQLLVEAPPPASSLRRFVLHGVRTSLFAIFIMVVMIGAGGARLHTVKEGEPMSGMKVLRHSVLGLALMAASERTISAQGEGAVLIPATSPKSVGAAGKSEDGAIVAMGLTQDETTQFHALLATREEKTAAFKQMKDGPERTAAGKAIGAWYRETMQTLFTPEQYSKYLEYWEFNAVVIKHGVKKGEGDYQVTVTLHPFERDNQLIQVVKPTKELAVKLTAMQGEFAKKYSQLNQLIKTPEGLSEFDSMVAQMQKERNDQLKKILTAEQYQQYRAALNAMIEASWNRTTAARAAAGGGFAAPIK